MSNMFQEVQEMAGEQIKRFRWALGLSGALAIVFALVIIIWPSISLEALVIVFGIFALARGIIGLMVAIRSPIKEGRGWLVLASLAGIGIGIAVFVWTDMSALALLYVIGAYALTIGILTVVGALRLPLDSSDKTVLVLSGLVSVAFGALMIAKPGDCALVLLALIAAYALVVGIAELTVAIGWRRLLTSATRDYVPTGPQAAH